MFSPIMRKRILAFRKNWRAMVGLVCLAAIFLFSLFAEFVCDCDPYAVTDPASLERFREEQVIEKHDVRVVRYNRLDDGTIVRYEGPGNVNIEDYIVTETKRDGYTRVFMEPRTPPKLVSRVVEKKPIAWPFRPVEGHPLGIDACGRDVYARVVHGLRIALLFGLILAFWAVAGGVVIGAIEGYFGGWVDILGQRLTEIWSAMPFLYVMIFIASAVGRSFKILLVCYALFNWIVVSYYVRAEFLRLRARPFVEAAKCQGLGTLRIIFRHILPNALTPVITLFPFLLMGAIGSLAALDFLGFGLPAMTPSLGELLYEAQQFRWAWWLVLFPGLALFFVMFFTVLVGEGLRDVFDPRRKSVVK